MTSTEVDIHSLQRRFIKLEQDLQCSGHTRGLDLAPKSALGTSDAIHDTGDIPEAVLELFT